MYVYTRDNKTMVKYLSSLFLKFVSSAFSVNSNNAIQCMFECYESRSYKRSYSLGFPLEEEIQPAMQIYLLRANYCLQSIVFSHT